MRRSSDRGLERTLASRPGLRLLFAAMARRLDPAAADGFTGAVVYVLRAARGEEVVWTVDVGLDSASARPGGAADPALLVRMSRADLVRLAAGEIDPGAALLDGRIDLEGDFAVAMRLGPMFGRPG